MTLAPTLKMTGVTGVIMLVIAFYMFFTLSIAILIVMEGVSAMLHCEYFSLSLSLSVCVSVCVCVSPSPSFPLHSSLSLSARFFKGHHSMSFSRKADGLANMFLHSVALRLAWVESFSKFAEFAGWPFAPFSFRQLLEESEELKEYTG